MKPRVICLVGCDGSGKSTLARFVVDELRRRGHKSVLIWSRFNNFLSKPLLALARLLGHSRYEMHDGVKFGYHDFKAIFWLRWPFILLQVIDVSLAVRYKLRKAKKQGDVIVFERSPWDTLADVILDTGCTHLVTSRVGRWMVNCVAGSGCSVLWINRSKELILTMRKELKHDRKLDEKLAIYEHLAKAYNWTTVDNNPPLDDVRKDLTQWLDNKGL